MYLIIDLRSRNLKVFVVFWVGGTGKNSWFVAYQTIWRRFMLIRVMFFRNPPHQKLDPTKI